jgi:hypothetical protein
MIDLQPILANRGEMPGFPWVFPVSRMASAQPM